MRGETVGSAEKMVIILVFRVRASVVFLFFGVSSVDFSVQKRGNSWRMQVRGKNCWVSGKMNIILADPSSSCSVVAAAAAAAVAAAAAAKSVCYLLSQSFRSSRRPLLRCFSRA